MMGPLHYQFVADPPNEIIDRLAQEITEYSRTRVSEAALRDHGRFAILATDPAGVVEGGIYGEMRWDWLFIKLLWVDAGCRGQRIGTRLLAKAEAAALEKGLCGSHLETTSYQALDFYLKNGYEVFGTLEGKPRGGVWYFMKKVFPQTEQAD